MPHFFSCQPPISKCLSSAFLFKDTLSNIYIYIWLIHTELTANRSLLGLLNKGSPAPASPSASHFTASQHLRATGSTWALCLEVILKSQFLTSSQKSEKCSITQSAKEALFTVGWLESGGEALLWPRLRVRTWTTQTLPCSENDLWQMCCKDRVWVTQFSSRQICKHRIYM